MNAQYILSFFNMFLCFIAEVQKMLEENNTSLNDVEPAPLDTM